MTVSFYGHVRQYHNIKAEIDANMQEVLESGQYVMGPMLKQFEKELAAYHGTKYAVGVGNGTDALWLAFMALGIGPGDESSPPEHLLCHRRSHLDRRRHGRLRGFRPQDQVHRPGEDRGRHHAQDQGASSRSTSTASAPTWWPSARSPTSTSCSSSRTTRRPSAPRGDGFKIGELSDAVCTSFIIQKNLGTFGDGGALVTNNARSMDRWSASCATTARQALRATASASTAAWTTSTPASSAPS